MLEVEVFSIYLGFLETGNLTLVRINKSHSKIIQKKIYLLEIYYQDTQLTIFLYLSKEKSIFPVTLYKAKRQVKVT